MESIDLAKFKLSHWIQLSSAGVYDSHGTNFIDEHSNLQPSNEYEKTKLSADDLIITASKIGYFEYTLIRPTIVIGNHMKNKSIPNLIKNIERKRFFYIDSKEAILNLVPYQIVSKSMFMCIQNKKTYGKTYIINKPLKIKDIVRIVLIKINSYDRFFTMPSKLLYFLIYFLRFLPAFPLTKQRVSHLSNSKVYSGVKILTDLNTDVYADYDHFMDDYIDKVISVNS